MRLKTIRYQQDAQGILIGLQVLTESDFQSPLFCDDERLPYTTLSMANIYDDEGYYRCDNVAARIESSKTVSNLYFNADKTGIVRVGFKRGKGTL